MGKRFVHLLPPVVVMACTFLYFWFYIVIVLNVVDVPLLKVIFAVFPFTIGGGLFQSFAVR